MNCLISFLIPVLVHKVCVFTVVKDSGWIMVGSLQSPEVDGSAWLAVAMKPDGLHLTPKQRETEHFRGKWLFNPNRDVFTS